MEHFNLIKSLTRVNNIITLPFREGLGLGLKSIRTGLLCLSLAVFGVNEAWGANGYWAKAKTTISSFSPTGSGKIYEGLVQYSSGGEKQDTDKDGYAGGASKSQTTINFSLTAATPNDGYSFKGWATSDGTPAIESGSSTTGWTYGVKTASNKGESKANKKTFYAVFTPVYYAVAYTYAQGNGKTWVTINGTSFSGGFSKADDSSSKETTGGTPNTYSIEAYAQPNEGYVFKGWYKTSDCSGEPISMGDANKWNKYTEDITQTLKNPGTEVKLYAKFEEGKSYTYYATAYAEARTESGEKKNGVGLIYISCKGNKPTTDSQYTASDGQDYGDNNPVTTEESSINVTADYYAKPLAGYSFGGWYKEASMTNFVGKGTSQTEGWHYQEVFAATSTDKNNPTKIYRYAKFIPVKVNAAEAQTINFTAQTETKSVTLTFPVANASSNNDFYTPTVDNGWSVSSWNYTNNQVTVVVSFTATENTTTKDDHIATVTLTAKSGNSASGQVTAHIAMTPIYTCTIADKYLVDDNAIDLNTFWTSSSNGAKHYEITSFTPSGSNNDGATAPAINGTILSLGQAGTVKLKLTQDAGTSSVAGAEQTKIITVSKRDNAISSSFASSMFMDAKQNGAISSNNSITPITATQTAGNTIAVLNDAQTQVTSNHNLGDATWNVSQPENYKYKAANATFTISVIKQTEATNCYVLEDYSEHSFSTDITDFGGHFDTPLKINGPAYQLKFDAKKNGVNNFVAQYSIDGGSNWTDIVNEPDLTDSYKTFGPYNVPDNATHIRFGAKTGATLKKWYKNIRVTRKTYLNAANVEITETSSENPIHPNEEGVGTLTINHSLANGGNLKVKWDNDKFTINGKTAAQGIDLGDLGCSTGVSNLPISYTSAKAGPDIANVVIYNNVYRATATITGTTIKRDQNLQWNTDIMLVGQTEPKAAQTTSIINGIVTYESDDTDIIRVKEDDNGQLTILEALQPGTANITAFSAGNEEYNDAESTKKITVTDKQIQYITWNQSLMGLKMGDADVPLNASAYQPDSLKCATGGQRPITYSSANTAVVEIVDGNKLRIKGIGVTTVTASQAGGKDNDGHDFIAVTAEKKVVVRDPNAPCETYIYEQTSEVEFDLSWIAVAHQTKTYEIDFHGQEPGFVNFDYKGKVHTVWPVDYYEGTLSIEQYVNNQWVEVRNFGKPGTSGYTNTGDIALNRKATKMRVKAADGMGYMYFKDCRVTLARYLEGATLSTFETKVGAPLTKTLTIKYSNISGPVTFSLSENSNFSISQESIEGECGGYGTTSLDITYTPTTQTIGEEATLTLADDIQKTYIVLKGNASVTPLHINWDIPDNNTCYTIQSVNLSAKALTDLNVEIPNFVWFSLAQNSTTGILTGNTLTFDKAGNANVVAQTTGDPRYTPAQNVFKNWTVNLTPTEVVTKPEIDGEIVYGVQLTDLKLKANTGAARNTINQQAVEGTFAITSGDISTAGQHTVTVTFTPANTDMYASCTKDITVTVQKAQPNALAHAGDIIYGAAVGTSVLTNEGTTAGTWTWTDEKKDQVLNVGTYEGLQVHFTPTDQTNYNEIDGTVSLTVTAATPTLEWTAKPETAQVHEVKTFTASSTNTDNTAAITYSITDGTDCASINASTGEVTMLKAGTITIQASQAATTNFNAATSITTTCTINITPTEIVTNPEIDGEVVYGAQLTDLKLKANTGAARNTINQQAVEGTFAITSGDISTAGEKTITVTFTPANTDMYASCTKDITVTVQKAQPNAHAHAGSISYGATVQTSTLTNEGTEGTWSWTDEKKDQVLNVGTYEGLQVHFTPTDQTNYNEIDGTVSLTVTKAQPTITWTGETTFEWGEINNYFVASNSGEVVMSSLDESIATIQNNKIIPVKAGTVAIQGNMAESDNYQSATLTQTITINVPSENKFTNAAGDNDWNNPTNWSAGLVPEKMDEANIVVSGELNIKEEVVVGSLTIEDGGSVNVLQGGDLTIQAESGEADAFGDLYVKNGGDVTLNGTLNVHDFVIESSIGTADGSSKSGQITNADKLNFNEGDAYIDIHLDPSGTADDSQWYGFTVPFEVDIATGVYRQENDGLFKQLKDKTNFDIMQYNPAKRLTTGKGWEYYHGVLNPGEFYYLAIDGTNNVYRFRKNAGAGFTTEAQVELHTNGDATNPNANWNPVGNPCLRYTTTDYDGFVQVYKNGQSAYLTVDASDVTYVVGCPFFVQAQEEGSLVLETSNATEGQFYAPRRMAADKTKNQIQLLNQGKVEDQIFIMASEDATSDYEAGSDLLKAGVSKLCGQMWINAYGQQLSVQDAPLQEETALYNLSLYAPKAGEYMLHVGSQNNSGEIYLTLNGTIIWNLSQSDYPISLFKGTTDEYGLVFKCTQQTMPTTIDAPTKTKGVDKFIHHEQMYILHNGQLYNAMGATVK